MQMQNLMKFEIENEFDDIRIDKVLAAYLSDLSRSYIQKLISVQGLGNDYSKRMTVGSGVEYAIYGLAYELIPDTFDHFSNQMVDKLQLDYSGNGSSPHIVYRLFRKDPPPVYKYMRRSGWVTQGKAEDILTYNQVGEYADSVLAIVESNDIKAIVVINDKE